MLLHQPHRLSVIFFGLTKVDMNGLGLLVDPAHDRDLLLAARNARLVDVDGIGPQGLRLVPRNLRSAKWR